MTLKHLKPLLILLPVLLGLLLFSCTPSEQPSAYPYEKNPKLSWGVSSFYGQYYQHYDVESNVFSLHLFSDSLFINEDGELDGHGQYLIIEDLFTPHDEILLPTGRYVLSDSTEPFSFFGGKTFVDGYSKIPSGTMIYYIMPEPEHSKMEYITSGYFDVSYDAAGLTTMHAQFVLGNDMPMELQFKGNLSIENEEANTPPSSYREMPYKLKHHISTP